jgi:hypothetical protein
MRRLPSTAYKKGESGNPRGRPKVNAEVRDLARVHTAGAINTLASIMQNGTEPASARVSAASILLDRGHGKAPQVIESENYDIMTDCELDRRLAEAVAELRALGCGHVFDEPAEEDKKKPH